MQPEDPYEGMTVLHLTLIIAMTRRYTAAEFPPLCDFSSKNLPQDPHDISVIVGPV